MVQNVRKKNTMSQRIVFTGKQKAALETFETPEMKPKQIRAKVFYSLLSTGTETIVYNQDYDPGTHWDLWIKHPFYPGYAAIGEVTDVGAEVEGFKVGDQVAMRSGHASEHVLDPGRAYVIPSGTDLKQASWFALAKITFQGAYQAQYQLGSSVVIIGAGPIGQISLRWAKAAGCEKIIVVDPEKKRLEMALAGGASAVIAVSVESCADAIREANYGELTDIVMDTTGNHKVFSAALDLAPRYGRVVLLGDTGHPESQHLCPAVVRNGLSIAGAHDSHVYGVWTADRINRLFFNLLSSGRMNLENLITHTFKPESGPEAYEVANRERGQTMGLMIDWT
jgi:2-desacetyl-2-hydroxyethyl bacteriochlorophyllide A dehydrogenase